MVTDFLQSLRRHKRAPWIGTVLIAVALAVLPFVLEASLSRTWVRIVDFALLYAMLAMGLNIVVGFAGLLDLGYIAFYAVGAYSYALLASPHFGVHLPFWILLPIGALVAAFFGILLGSPTLRLRGDYLAIVTLGFGEIIRIFLNNLNAPVNITNGPQGVNRIDPVSIAGMDFTKTHEILGVTVPGRYRLGGFFQGQVSTMALDFRFQTFCNNVKPVGFRGSDLRKQFGCGFDTIPEFSFGLGITCYKCLGIILKSHSGLHNGKPLFRFIL